MENINMKNIVISVLLVANVLWGVFYFIQRRELVTLRNKALSSNVNAGVVVFARDFVETVLRAKTEVDFETRLRLENSVRNLKDKEVLTQWGKFVNSKSETEAQEEVKSLLSILMKKIDIK